MPSALSSARTSFTQLEIPSALLVERGCAAIVEMQRARNAELRDAIILVPDLHAVSTIACALRSAADVPMLLLPNITTLAAWAAGVALAQPIAARSAREVTLYQALAARPWLENADLWTMARELSGLFEEMTRHNVALAVSLDDFSVQLEAAYRARPSSALRFEAQLVHELWWAMSRDSRELAPEAAYQLRLARLAQEAVSPLYCLGLSRITPSECAFLVGYAQRAPVALITAVADSSDPAGATLDAAWPRAGDVELRARAHALRTAHPQSAFLHRVRIFGATSAEQEAQAIDVTVREWLLAGKSTIAVIVQDRVVARRARALLERAQVLVTDEAGWALSTTSAATVLGRWLDIAVNDAYHQDLLDLMKSPFAFHDVPREERRQWVWRLEQYVREANVVSGIARYIKLARRHGDAEVEGILRRVEAGLGALTRNRKPLARWLAALDDSLTAIGVRAGLEADPAGEQLLELLADLGRELEGSEVLFSFADSRRWLARELEAATFHDRGVDSPVVFTYLAATRLRRFDAVLVCGCDAQHLPGPETATRLFNQGVRADLGLPTRSDELRDVEDQLGALLATSGCVTLTWQRQVAGEENLLSPLVARLLAVHSLAYSDDLNDHELALRLPGAMVASARDIPLPLPSERPRPAAHSQLVPSELSASAYNALVACPYQFHARHMLRLGVVDEVLELVDKRDYGNRLHAILAQFHRAMPLVSAHAPALAERTLHEYTDAVFRDAVAENYLARAWVVQWKALIPDYLDWQRAREAEGWRWYAAEVRRRIEITTPAGHTLTLVGRLDRVDLNASGQAAVLDYKTTAEKTLRDKLKQAGEDVQLPVYALLWGGAPAAALFLALGRTGIKEVPAQDLARLMSEQRIRIARLYDLLRSGAPLPAHGMDSVCEYCEARGLCRRDYWS